MRGVTMMHRCAILALLAVCFAGAGAPAWAQALAPMRGEARSLTDRFALQLRAVNYGEVADHYQFEVLNPDFSALPDARMDRRRVTVGANSSAGLIVLIPFEEGEDEREVLVCMERQPELGQPMMIRGQVCGRYFGRRLSR